MWHRTFFRTLVLGFLLAPVASLAQVTVSPETLSAGDLSPDSTWSAPLAITNQGVRTVAWSLSRTGPPGSAPIPLRRSLTDLHDLSTLWDRVHGAIPRIVRFENRLRSAGASHASWGTGPLTPELLGQHHVLVVPATIEPDGGAAWTEDDLDVLVQWVHEGGGLLLQGGGPVRVEAFNDILRRLGVAIELIPEPAVWGATDIWMDHPVTSGIVPMTVFPDARLTTSAPAFPFLAAADGTLIGAVSQAGAGRVAVATADLLASGTSDDYFRLGLQLVGWLSGISELTAEPAEDWAVPGAPSQPLIHVNTRGLPGGSHGADLLVDFQDSTVADISIPLEFQVSGSARAFLPDPALDLGTITVDEPAVRPLVLVNHGAQDLRVTRATSAPPSVIVPELPIAVGSLQSASISVSVRAREPGPFRTTLLLHTNDPDQPTVPVSIEGTAQRPPLLEADLADVAETLLSGAATQRTFRVENRGDGPLRWEALVSQDAASPEQDLAGVRIGWPREIRPTVAPDLGRWIHDATQRGATLVELDEPLSAESLRSLDALWIGYGLDPLDSAEPVARWVRNGGRLVIEEHDNDMVPILNALGVGIDYVVVGSPTRDYITTDGDHELTLGELDLYLASTHTYLVVDDPAVTVLFRDPNGEPAGAVADVGQGQLLVLARGMFLDAYIGFADNREFGARVSQWLGGGRWLSVSPTRGSVPAGGSVDLTLNISADGLSNADYSGALTLQHNDSGVPFPTASVLLQVTPAARLDLETTVLSFPETVAGAQASLPLVIGNRGNRTLVVEDLNVDAPTFSISSSPLEIEPGSVDSVTVTFSPPAAGSFQGTATLTTNDPGQPQGTASLSGTSDGTPSILVQPDALPVTLVSGDMFSDVLAISNPGDSPLEWKANVNTPRSAGRRAWTLPARTVELRDAGGTSTIPAITAEFDDLTGVRILFDRLHGSELFWFSTVAEDLTARGAVITEATEPITPAMLADADIAWIYCRLAWSPSEAEVLGEWVRNGGAIIVEGLNASSQNVVLSAIDAGVAVKETDAVESETGTIFPHPTTRGIEHLDWKFTSRAWLRPDAPGVQTLLTDPELRPMGTVTEQGRARVVSFGTIMFSDTVLDLGSQNRRFANQVFDWLAGQWLSATPESGVLPAGEVDSVSLTWNPRNLAPGTWPGTVLVEHNVPGLPPVAIDAPLTVVPGARFTSDTDSVSLGTVSLGVRRSATVRIDNPGDLPLTASVDRPTDGPFSWHPASITVAPGAHADLELAFAPTLAGEHFASFAWTHNAHGSPHTIAVRGTGISAPSISVEPVHTIQTLPIGTTHKRTVSICNDREAPPGGGADPLEFRVRIAHVDPDRSRDADNASLEPVAGPLVGSGGPDAHGYAWADSDTPGGPDFDWIDLTGIATAMAPAGDESLSDFIPLPFDFPFYDESFSALRISSNGWVSFSADEPSPESRPLPSADAPPHLMAAYWDDLTGGEILHHGNDERFVVQFHEMSRLATGGTFTFQVILYPDGRFAYQYLDMASAVLRASVGIQNGTRDDGLLVAFQSDYAHNDLAVEFGRGAPWIHVSPRTGSIAAGQCQELTLEFDTSPIFGGDYQVDLVVESNDPLRPRVPAHITLRVPGDPAVSVEPAALSFSKLALGRSESRTFRVSNVGDAILSVSEIRATHAAFQVDAAFDLRPGKWRDVSVRFEPQSLGLNSGDIVVISNDPKEPNRSVRVTGIGLAPPELVVLPLTLSEDLFSREVRTHTLAIANEGEADLDWQILATFPAATAAARATPDDLAGLRILRPTGWDDYPNPRTSTIVADLRARGAEVVEASTGVSAATLATFDILWIASQVGFSEPTRETVREWVEGGGAVLLSGGHSAIRSTFNEILGSLGAGITVLGTPGQSGISMRIRPHAATADVDSLSLAPQSTLQLDGAHAGVLFEDRVGALVGAFSQIGTGRVLVIADDALHDHRIGLAENRVLGARVFEWLHGPTWLSVTPSSGRTGGGEVSHLSVRVDATNVLAREHLAELRIFDEQDEESDPRIVDVRLGVTDALVVDSDSLWLSTATASGVRDTLRITNIGPVAVPYSIASSLVSYVPPASTGTPLSRGFQLDLTGKQILVPTGHGETSLPGGLGYLLYELGAEVGSFPGVITEEILQYAHVVAIAARDDLSWTPEEADALAAWVHQGGGLVFVHCVDDAVDDLNRLASVVGAGFRFSPEDGASEWITEFASHFLTEGIDRLYHSKNPCQLVDVRAPAHPLLKDSDSNLCGVYSEVGAGRVVALTSDLIGYGLEYYPSNPLLASRIFSWTSQPDWVEVEPTTALVPAGESAEVVLNFATPGVKEGIYRGDVFVHLDGLGQAVDTVAVSLTVGNPNLALDVSTLSFGDVYTDHSAARSVAVSNLGNLPLVIREISTSSGAFTTSDSALTLAPGEGDTLLVTFLPIVNGPHEATLRLLSNDPDEPAVAVSLVANALQSAAQLAVSPAAIDFGEVRVATAVSESLLVENVGQAPLVISEISAGDPSISVVPSVLSMGEGGQAWVVVAFQPTVSGVVAEPIVFHSNDPDDPALEVPLAAIVLDPPIMEVTPSELSADLVSGETSVDSLLVRNVGEESLEWQAVIADRRHERGPPQNLSAIRILFDRSNGQPPSALWSDVISDLENRGAVVSENTTSLDADVLASADVLWITDGNDWGTSEADAVATWMSLGGAVLIEGDLTTTAFNRILTAMDASFRYLRENGGIGISGFVNPHWCTAGVDSIAAAGGAQLVTAPDSYVLFEDVLHLPGGVAERIGKGRLVALSEQLGSNLLLGNADNRRFANRVFDWLAGAVGVVLTPSEGSVAQADSQRVMVSLETLGLSSGLHTVDVLFTGDDPVNPEFVVSVNVQVSGSPAIHLSPAVLDFGDVFAGGQVVESMGVFNPGTDTLFVSSIVSSSPDFIVDVAPFPVLPSSSVLVDVTFVAGAPAAYAGELTVTSNDPITPVRTIALSGISVLAPVIEVTPSMFSPVIPESTVARDTLLVANHGESTLDWHASFEDDDPTSDTTDLLGVRVLWDRSHGQTGVGGRSILSTNLELRGATVSVSTHSLTREHLDGFDVLWSGTLSLAWSPAELAAVVEWVQRGGALLLEGTSDLTVQVYNEALSALGTGMEFTRLDAEPGNITNLAPHWITETVTSVTLLGSGAFLSGVTEPAVRVFDDVSGRPIAGAAEVGEGRVFACLADRVFRNDRSGAARLGGRVFEWFHSWVVAHPTLGSLAPGETTAVAVSFQSFGRPAGFLAGRLTIENNDPVNPRLEVPLSVRVVGIPVISVAPDTLVMENVFVARSQDVVVRVDNVGSEPLVVSSVVVGGADYSAVPASFSLDSGLGRDVVVTLLASGVGDRSTTLTLEHNAEGSTTVVPIIAHARLEPELERSPAVVDVTMSPNSELTRPLTICNVTPNEPPGEASDLHFELTVNDASSPLGRALGGHDDFGHFWIDSDTPGGPSFQWIDIRDVGTPLDLVGNDINRGPFPIGFDFPFYGDTVTEFRASTNGWISFSSQQAAPTNLELPCACPNSPPSQLAIWWDDLRLPTGAPGWYHSDGERLIVQYEDAFRLGPTGGPYSFEAILHSDGRIVFQYREMEGVLDSATIGLQNETLNDGLTIAHNAAYMHDELAIELRRAPGWVVSSPRSGTVPAGECVDVDLVFRSALAMEAEDAATLVIRSNDPDLPETTSAIVLHVMTLEELRAATTDLPLSFALHANSPNPFDGTTRIRFDLPSPARSRITLYDVSGRQVRTLVDDDLPAGRHMILWDGRDGAGQRTAAGVYFYRMSAGDYRATRKMIHLR